MARLYPAYKHSALRADPWSEERVRSSIREIVLLEAETFHPRHLWPTHPLDGDDPYLTGFYLGAGGVFWGLSFLHRERATDELPDAFVDRLDSLIRRAAREHPFYPPENAPERSYLFGDIPLRMLQAIHSPEPSRVSAIYDRLQSYITGPVSELMWGLPGNMLAAIHLHAATREARWLDLYRLQAERMLEDATRAEDVGYHWVHTLYGQQHDGLGAVHGYGGHVIPLLAGLEHLPEDVQTTWVDRIAETLLATVVRDSGRANWPRSASTPAEWRVYHCHGAPGIVNSLGRFPTGASAKLEQTLLEAGELILDAGPLRKGPTLCHGTAGNGMALLKLYERTGNDEWLVRAREFAMHALWQVERSRELFGQPRHTLWTGDIGVAAFLNECLRATARFPTIDVF